MHSLLLAQQVGEQASFPGISGLRLAFQAAGLVSTSWQLLLLSLAGRVLVNLVSVRGFLKLPCRMACFHLGANSYTVMSVREIHAKLA